MRNGTWALMLALLLSLPTVTHSVFGLTETFGQLFGGAKSGKTAQGKQGEVSLAEMRRLRMQNLASVAAVLLHAEETGNSASDEQAASRPSPSGPVSAVRAVDSGASATGRVSAPAEAGAEVIGDAVGGVDGGDCDALWGFGDGAWGGRAKSWTKPREAGGGEGGGGGAGGGGQMEALLEEVQRLRAENEILKAHHDQDERADGKSKLLMHTIGVESLLKQSGAGPPADLLQDWDSINALEHFDSACADPRVETALQGWNQSLSTLLEEAALERGAGRLSAADGVWTEVATRIPSHACMHAPTHPPTHARTQA